MRNKKLTLTILLLMTPSPVHCFGTGDVWNKCKTVMVCGVLGPMAVAYVATVLWLATEAYYRSVEWYHTARASRVREQVTAITKKCTDYQDSWSRVLNHPVSHGALC